MRVSEFVPEEVSSERIRGHIQALEGVRHPEVAPEALEQAADYLAQTLASLEYQVGEHRFDDGGRSFRNVIGTRLGTRRPEERVLVIAHYDTVVGSPGADDNASGVAVLLEMARVLAQKELGRTVQFIGVSLEENAQEGRRDSGLRGSRALAQLARQEGWNITGALVLESVGFAAEDAVQILPPGVPIAVPGTGNFVAVIVNEGSLALARGFVRAVEQQGIGLPHVVLAVPGAGEMLPDTRRSDHAPFWDAGYPAVMLTDTTNFRNPNYHRPTDTLGTLNLDFAAKVCAAATGLVLQLASADADT